MFQCSLTGGGVRCVHSSQVYYVCYASAYSNASSLGAAYGGRIPDSSFSATSNYDYRYFAKHGRLNGPQHGWAQKTLNNWPNEYLQVDLGGAYWVCGVATQGEFYEREWTTKYKISSSLDKITWNIYQWNGSDKVGPVYIAFLVPQTSKVYCKYFPDRWVLRNVHRKSVPESMDSFDRFRRLCTKAANLETLNPRRRKPKKVT